ncbi:MULTISPECIES: very short patch repair endonuclease [Polaromonas]|uniref:Very short patch repair endonuclease n=1 Tax=Polaromonas aquatica TaxID=332657 RepID=A0ABW1TYD3_9BURK
MDRLTNKQRSTLMRKVRTKHTAPELIVRNTLHRLGYRYALHSKRLPGTPDIVLSSRKKVILVNGCFWHGHSCPRGALPSSNHDFWCLKIKKNKKRDSSQIRALENLGWATLVVWECETKVDLIMALQFRLIAFLES